jgi:hypothetical protein
VPGFCELAWFGGSCSSGELPVAVLERSYVREPQGGALLPGNFIILFDSAALSHKQQELILGWMAELEAMAMETKPPEPAFNR